MCFVDTQPKSVALRSGVKRGGERNCNNLCCLLIDGEKRWLDVVRGAVNREIMHMQIEID